MVNDAKCSTGPFQGWGLGARSRPQQNDECISPTDNKTPVFPGQSVSSRELDSSCPPLSMPPRTSSASTSDCSVDLRDSAGPSSLAFKDLDFRPTSKSKGKASIRNASFQSGQGVQLGDEQTSQKERYSGVSIRSGIPIRAPARHGCPSEFGGWNNGESLSETFAYYADAPRQKGFWSSLVQLKSRRSQDEDPEPAATDKHARAALCEKVIRNGGTHTAARTRNPAARHRREHRRRHGKDDRPFRINDNNAISSPASSKPPAHPQQQCQDPHQHSRVARCEMPVKSCLNCAAVASCSGSLDHDGRESLDVFSCTAGFQDHAEKQSSRWRKTQKGLQKAFS